MSDQPLRGRRILLVEDEYYLARDALRDLEAAGATIVGPVPTLSEALAAIGADAALDGAVLDVNLGGEMVYPAADVLSDRRVPFVFATGYDQAALPTRYDQRPRCEKPMAPGHLARTVERLLSTSP